MFLKSLLAQHVSDVTASIVRSTPVVFHRHRFLVSGVFSARDLYWCWAPSSLYHGQFQTDAVTSETCWDNKLVKNTRNRTFSWTRIKTFVTNMYGTTNIKFTHFAPQRKGRIKTSVTFTKLYKFFSDIHHGWPSVSPFVSPRATNVKSKNRLLWTFFIILLNLYYKLTVSTFGCFPSVWVILADVSDPSVRSIFKGLKCEWWEKSVVFICTVPGLFRDGRSNGGWRRQVLGGLEWLGGSGGGESYKCKIKNYITNLVKFHLNAKICFPLCVDLEHNTLNFLTPTVRKYGKNCSPKPYGFRDVTQESKI
jgi:hypothetical protein